MDKFFKILKLLPLLLFLYSCGSVGEALQGKKRSDQGDEFLVDKKNPLAMPPDFEKLPKPGEVNDISNQDRKSDQSNIKNLLKNGNDDSFSNTSESKSIESSILKKIKCKDDLKKCNF